MSAEPTLESLTTPPTVTPPTAPTVVAVPHRSWLKIGLAVVVLAVIGTAGLVWLRPSKPLAALLLADPAPSLTLAGLDTAQKLSGSCLASFIVNGLSTDEAGHQRFSLSVTLKSDPADQAALAKLLATAACAKELTTIETTVTTKLGLSKKADTPDQFTTSFVTKSGHRLFLP